MNKKILTTALLFLFCTLYITAQKVDLDKRRFETNYAILPTDPTLSYFDSYSVDFFAEQTTLDQIGLSATTINAYFDLEGYVYTKEQAEFNYSISIDKPIPLLEGIEEVQQTVKNSDGTTKVVTMYVAVATYAIPTNLTIRLIPLGTEIYSSTFSTRSVPTVYKSSPQSTRDAAQTILNAKSRGLNSNTLALYSQTLKAEVTKLKQKYCFQSFTSESLLWEIDEKSAPELAPFNKEVNTALAILEKLDKNIPLTSARTEMAPSLTYWSQKAASIQSTEKPLLKLKYACFYNMAVCQYYLELFDECAASCQLLIANNYDKTDGSILQTQANLAKETIKNSGLPSRHLTRKGFASTSHFEYTPIILKKPNFIEQNKQDFKELKGSINVIAKDLDDDFSNPKLTDTLKSSETFFAYLKYTQNNELIEFKGRELEHGYSMMYGVYNDCDALQRLSLFKKTGIIPPKLGAPVGFEVNFRSNYSTSSAFNTDSLIALIKLYQNDYLQDITTCHTDTLPFRNSGQVIPSKTVLGKDYPKKLSANVASYYYISDREGTQEYATNNGDAFKISITDVVPVLVQDVHTGKMRPNSYLVTMKIPEVTLTKLMIGHIWFYTYEYITLKNIEFRVLVMGSIPNE